MGLAERKIQDLGLLPDQIIIMEKKQNEMLVEI
jgi:hypothetical protein